MTSTKRAQLQIASFLVRLRWEETAKQGQMPTHWYGSGERWQFQDLKELLALIQARIKLVCPGR